MRALLIGDIVGRFGKRAVHSLVPELKKEFACDFCIANGENMAGGAGLSINACQDLHRRGVDVITSGDHIWDQKDFIYQINDLPFCIRPANLINGQPGKGYVIHEYDGAKLAVINLLGQVFMKLQCNNPFQVVDEILADLSSVTNCIFVDMHAEATSEKIAMGRYLEGRVTAVFGTHTHVQTADETVFAKGTAYITDLGMVGSKNSILGRCIEPVVHRFSTGLPMRFKVEDEDIVIHGAIVEFDLETGKAIAIERFQREWHNN